MPNFTLEVATTEPHNLGEGPFWDEKRGNLYYVDAFVGDVCKLNPDDKTVEKKHFGDGVTTIVIPVDNSQDEFIVSYSKKILHFNWKTDEKSELAEIEAGNDKTRLNDGKCDAKGRLWMGTVPTVAEPELGSLYRVNGPNNMTKHFGNVNLSNGMAWSNDSKYMYFADSMKRLIHVFDFDNQNGEISNDRILFDYNANRDAKPTELPDGMTIDLDGKLWVANYYGGRILNIDPNTAQIIDKIDLPATNITSLCFGGPNLNQFYITSAYRDITDAQRKNEPLAGSISINVFPLKFGKS
uniref:SMP-30/Gluconolactonase/LRE-like region domain-containing protein n=1 Tax=Strigamia maritima TaxID=126957 RepID=T1IXB7_STRMM